MRPWKYSLTSLSLVLTASSLMTGSLAGRDLYWTEQKQILASDIDGSNVAVIFDGETSTPPMASYAVDVAVTDTHVYWSGHSGRDIWRADRDGSNPVQLVTEAGDLLHFLAVNETGGKLYVSDFSSGLYQADLADGGNLVNVYGDAPFTFSGLAYDEGVSSQDELLAITTANNFLYRIVPSEWGGYVAEWDELEGGDATYGLALDSAARVIYYTNYTDGTLRSFDLETDEHKLLWTPGMTNPLGVKISPSGTHLLIAERGRGITGYEIATGGYELLVSASDAYFGVAVTADPGTLEVPPPPPPPPGDGDAIFSADFEEDTIHQLPLLESEGGVWSNWQPRTTPDSVFVVKDEENLFGYGADNQFLRIENSIGSYMDAPFSVGVDVATLSFDTILRRTTVDSGGSERNGFTFFGENGRLHVFSTSHTGGVRGGTGGKIAMEELARVDVILNNSGQEITYQSPEGAEETLATGYVAVWVDGVLADHYAAFGAQGSGGTIDYIRLPHFSSTDRYSMDLDNFTVFMGAHVMKPLVEGGSGYTAWQEQNFPGETDPSIIGPSADVDGDGLPNLLEYVLGQNPNTAGRDSLPSVAVQSITVDETPADYLTLTFTIPDSMTDMLYTVEVSDDLASWTAGGELVESTSNGDGTTTYTYRDSAPLDTGSQRFIRLNVSE